MGTHRNTSPEIIKLHGKNEAIADIKLGEYMLVEG